MIARDIEIEACDECCAPPHLLVWEDLDSPSGGTWQVTYDCGRRRYSGGLKPAEGFEGQRFHALAHPVRGMLPCRNIDIGSCLDCGAPPETAAWEPTALEGKGAWRVTYECGSLDHTGHGPREKLKSSVACLQTALAHFRRRVAELEARETEE